jgi:AcrR family transcriptional regulator
MTAASPGFSRLAVDERRRQLLERGRALFTSHAYDELSMAAIARDAGISKALLYHYFPSKQAYFVATLEDAAVELAERVRPRDGDPPREQLASALEAWLDWVEANRDSYGKLMRSANGVAELREIVDAIRTTTCNLICDRLRPGEEPPPELRSAVTGWLWFMDGVCLDWVEHRDVAREHVRTLLHRGLPGVLTAIGYAELAQTLL